MQRTGCQQAAEAPTEDGDARRGHGGLRHGAQAVAMWGAVLLRSTVAPCAPACQAATAPGGRRNQPRSGSSPVAPCRLPWMTKASVCRVASRGSRRWGASRSSRVCSSASRYSSHAACSPSVAQQAVSWELMRSDSPAGALGAGADAPASQKSRRPRRCAGRGPSLPGCAGTSPVGSGGRPRKTHPTAPEFLHPQGAGGAETASRARSARCWWPARAPRPCGRA